LFCGFKEQKKINTRMDLQSRKERPALSISIAAKVFVLALFGTTIHLNVYYAGLAYISPTVACALGNVVPSLTFLMAVLLRYILYSHREKPPFLGA
jgi:drug/metabolite transporter (DMT)-like permease